MMLNINTVDGMVPVKAAKVGEYLEVKYFLHQDSYRGWTATEYATGMCIGGGDTRMQAEEAGKIYLRVLVDQGKDLKIHLAGMVKKYGRANG